MNMADNIKMGLEHLNTDLSIFKIVFLRKRLENKGDGVGIHVRNDFSVKEFDTPLMKMSLKALVYVYRKIIRLL